MTNNPFSKDVFPSNSMVFKEITCDYAPAINQAYARIEILFPWPDGVNKTNAIRASIPIHEWAENFRNALEFAVNGLRTEDKFIIEKAVMSGLGERPETNASFLLYAPDGNKSITPQQIKSFIEENSHQIQARMSEYFARSQSSKQQLLP